MRSPESVKRSSRAPFGKCVRRESAGKANGVRRSRYAFALVDGRTYHGAADADRGSNRRHVDDVAGLQAQVAGGVAPHQQVIQVERGYGTPLPLQLDVTQGADLTDAAAAVQRAADGREPFDNIGSGALGIAEYEHAQRPYRAHRYAGLRADQSLFDALVDILPKLGKRQSSDRDRSHLRQVQCAVAADLQLVPFVDIAEQLHVHNVARAQAVVERHGSGHGRVEGRFVRLEDVVAEGLQCFLARQFRRQYPDIDVEIRQVRLGAQAAFDVRLGQPEERHGFQARQGQHAGVIEDVGMTAGQPLQDRVVAYRRRFLRLERFLQRIFDYQPAAGIRPESSFFPGFDVLVQRRQLWRPFIGIRRLAQSAGLRALLLLLPREFLDRLDGLLPLRRRQRIQHRSLLRREIDARRQVLRVRHSCAQREQQDRRQSGRPPHAGQRDLHWRNPEASAGPSEASG